MATGSSERAVSALQDVFRATKQMRAKEEALSRQGGDDEAALAKLERELQAAQEKAIACFTEAVKTARTGDE
ncbi:hypothetical protein, partial [Staphylococcus aureus]|uniref:hypothetical protein n=1 Tax=Staphylococcus aureus TaxID=1280 RepID=UPI0032B4A938